MKARKNGVAYYGERGCLVFVWTVFSTIVTIIAIVNWIF